MKIETLKKSHLKRNIMIGVGVVLIISAVILNLTRAKYRVTESIPLVNGTINYTPYDFKMVAMYQENDNGEYINVDKVPTSGYILNIEQSYCEIDDKKDDNIKIEYINGQINFLGMTIKGTKCFLYFDEISSIGSALLMNYPTQLTRTDFSTTITDTTSKTIYYADTSKGRTYYFAGNPTDNWIKFAGYYWRIVRINEDGTIRIIYNGLTTNLTGNEMHVGTSYFTEGRSRHDVGYMYESEQPHGLKNSSIAKEKVDEWYQNNLIDYTDKIDGNVGFCGDRTPSSDSTTINGTESTGGASTYFPAYIRLRTNKGPTFECMNDSDLYTTSGSTQGNKALTYPIGLITADEVAYAGGVYGLNNDKYYLYSDINYWTISPSYAQCGIYGCSRIMYVSSSNGMGEGGVYQGTTNSYGIRPVINLRSDITISGGDGTASNPYVVAT